MAAIVAPRTQLSLDVNTKNRWEALKVGAPVQTIRKQTSTIRATSAVPSHRLRWTRPPSAPRIVGTQPREVLSPRNTNLAEANQKLASVLHMDFKDDKTTKPITSLEYRKFLEQQKRLLLLQENVPNKFAAGVLRKKSASHINVTRAASPTRNIVRDVFRTLTPAPAVVIPTNIAAPMGAIPHAHPRPMTAGSRLTRPLTAKATTADTSSPGHTHMPMSGWDRDRRLVMPPRLKPAMRAVSATPITHTSTVIADTESASLSEFGSKSGNMDDYILGKQIGQGAYAVVRFGLHKSSGKKVAIKIYEKYKLLDIQRKKSVRREIKLLEKLNHHNIIRQFEAVDTAKHVNLVLEYAGGGSLHSYLKQRSDRRLDENEARRIFRQVVSGLSYCHNKNVTHRDIKLENLLLDDQGSIKIIDFGFSTCTPPNKRLKIFCGTPSYMAPEIVGRKEYCGHPADIWALGVLMYAMLCGTFPFKGTNDRDLYRKIMRGVFNMPEHISTAGRQLIYKMLSIDASKRPTIDQIAADAWVTGVSSSIQSSVVSSRPMNLPLHLPARPASAAADFHTRHAHPAVVVASQTARVTVDKEPKEPLMVLDEEAIKNIEKLGYGRDEIIRQIREGNSHLANLYHRILKEKLFQARSKSSMGWTRLDMHDTDKDGGRDGDNATGDDMQEEAEVCEPDDTTLDEADGDTDL
eukprot:GILJ01002440.1.p1 GENE.GILJ01002440.1~~GILJ01002440.1.p1  ORF type:complete len:691 (+),score=87.38 GILJ01002440.1:103-2175(+)